MKNLLLVIAMAASFNAFSAETTTITKLTNSTLNQAKAQISTIDFINTQLMKKIVGVDSTAEERLATVNKVINDQCFYEDGVYTQTVTRDQKGLNDIKWTFYRYFDDAMPEMDDRIETMQAASVLLLKDKNLEVYVGADQGFMNEGAALAVYDTANSELYVTMVNQCVRKKK